MPHNWLTVLLTSMAVILVLFIPVWCAYRKKMHHRYLFTLGYVLVLVWILRVLVGSYQPITPDGKLTFLETIFDGMVHALQTFSMDEDYTAYTFAGKEYLINQGWPFWADVYGLVHSFLGVLSPVLGGALLLDILASFFPYLKLCFYFRRDKFVFSALNEKSVALAEDVARQEDFLSLLGISRRAVLPQKPLFVFSDVYLDQSSESSSELYARARNLGAICLKRDLIHLNLKRSKTVTYFLLDNDSHQNISTLAQLLEDPGTVQWPAGSDPNVPVTRIYVFGESNTDFALAKRVCAAHPAAAKQVLVRPIPDLINTSFNLMYEAPLFLPLLSAPTGKNRELHVTIMGSGPMAQELLKSVYWCGQMESVGLHITVLCDDKERMRQRIEEDCPELIPSCTERDKLLRTCHYVDNEFNPPYCRMLDFRTVSTGGLSAYSRELLEHTNYHILALESDEENLRIAELLRVRIAQLAMETGSSSHPVIAPAVKDHRLGDVVRNLTPGQFEPYVIPFASLRDRYSCKQVFLTNFTAAVSINTLYGKRHQDKDKDDIYNSISSTARCVHAPYKIFDRGLIRRVDLQAGENQRYVIEQAALDQEQEDLIAWTEHRRWNAFLRSLGFRCPSQEQLDHYFAECDSMKNITNKLHPCLVESRVTPVPLPEKEDFDRTRYDQLDYVAMYGYKLRAKASGEKLTPEGLRDKDYKPWDYRANDAALRELLEKD